MPIALIEKMDPLGIATTAIFFIFIFSIAIFIFSIIRHWKKIYIIYWGFMVFLSLHLFLFSLVTFSSPDTMPAPLKAYTIGLLTLLDMLIGL